MKFNIYTFLIFLFFVACNNSNSKKETPQQTKISVAAASNLRDVLQELKTAYVEENPDKIVGISFGSSGLLVQQILNGAPFDLFLSADNEFPERLKNEGKTSGEAKIYAYGKVAMWSTKQDVSQGLKLILSPNIKKIAIANPKLAPYGKNTVDALKKANLYNPIESKIVWAENIGQSAQFASTGNAEVGFIALSNAKNKEMQSKGNYYELSEEECLPIAQSGVVLKGKNEVEAKRFFDFITSEKANKIWEKYGYKTGTK